MFILQHLEAAHAALGLPGDISGFMYSRDKYATVNWIRGLQTSEIEAVLCWLLKNAENNPANAEGAYRTISFVVRIRLGLQ